MKSMDRQKVLWTKPIHPGLQIVVSVLLSILVLLVPNSASALLAPPADMFQLPWEQGKAWVAFDGIDNGTKRLSTSPHNYFQGGAIDFAPHNNMVVGEDTSNAWVVSVAAGTVSQVGYCWLKVDHGNGWVSEYWHITNIQAALGEKVSRNQKLGIIHNSAPEHVCTGNEFPGPHLHFVFRPKIYDPVYSGWNINYSLITNITSFSKNGLTVNRNESILNIPDLQIVQRGLLAWDTPYQGTVDPYRHERWTLELTELTEFSISVPSTTNGLVAAIVLLDSGGVEIARANGTLNTTQPAGTYYVQIQSDLGTGCYDIIATRTDGGGGETPTPTATDITDTPTATSTGNIPTITSTPVTNTPVTVSATPTVTGTVITDTLTPSSTPVTFTPTITNTPFVTETPPPTPIGTYVLTDIPVSSINVGGSSLVSVSLMNVPPSGFTSAEFTCTYDPVLLNVSNISIAGLFGVNPAIALAGPSNGSFILAVSGTNGQIATAGGIVFNFNITGLQAGLANVTCTARVSEGLGVLVGIPYIDDSVLVTTFTPTPTATVGVPSSISGQVIGYKPVTIQIFDAGDVLVTSVLANPDGTFIIPVPSGTYTVVASAEGYLNAQGTALVTPGMITPMTIINLPAGDIDQNNVIDQFDALTIGMNYNFATPVIADLNNDGVIDFLDLELLALYYHFTGPLAW